MKAAIVRELGRPPVYGDFPDPTPGPGEQLVMVTASAISQLVRGRASGSHYSAKTALPFVPGVDGAGHTPDGRRVLFAFPRAPFGSLAEQTVVPSGATVDLPGDLEDATAAGAANPGMSCWIPLTRLAPVHPDESVLINGATGIAGQMAVQVAKYLGASKVIATGRDEAKLHGLSDLGADVLLPLPPSMEALRDAVRKEAREANIGVVLDYLWGPSAEAILQALGGPNAPRGPARVRFVQVGGLAGTTITLDSSWLRSSGVEILGTGLGSSSNAALVAGMGEFLHALAQARFRIPLDVHPLSEVERVWQDTAGAKRIVLTVP